MRQHAGWLVAAAAICALFASSALSGPTTPAQIDGCVYNATPPTLSDGQTAVFQCSSDGKIQVNATASLTNPTINAAVPATANYIAGNVGGILQGVTLENTSGSIYAMDVKCVVGCGGNTNGQATMANSAPVVIASNQSNVPVSQATAASFNATVTQGPSAALGSGWAIKGDEVSDTTGTFTNATQTTSITASSLDGYDTGLVTITGTYGTATAVFEGSDDGGTTWFAVQGARSDGTATELGYTGLTNITRAWIMPINGFDALRVRSTAVASGTANVRISVLSQSTAAASMNSLSGFGAGVDTNNGAVSAATQRVTIASDSTGQVKLATGANTIGALTANQSVNVSQINAVTPLMGNGVTGTGSQRVTIASDNTAFSVNGTLQTQTDTIMIGGVNIKEINAVTPLMGNGVTGTGSQRVTIASDNTPFGIKGAVTPADAAALGTTAITTFSYNGIFNGTTIDLQREVANGTNSTGAGIPMHANVAQCDDVSQTAITENSFGNQRIECATHAAVATLIPSATAGGLTLSTLTLAASTNATNVKASAGQLYAISGFNMSSATPVWVSLYNNAGTPTCGTSIVYQFLIPGSTTGAGFVHEFTVPLQFSTGIAYCATTGIAGTGSPAATTYVVNFGYK